MSWLSSGGIMESKPSLLGGDGGGSGGGKGVGNWWVKIAAKIRKFNYYHYIGSVKLRKSWWKKLLVAWIVFWVLFCFGVFWCMSSYAVEKRKESLASMCDERARMLQDQFNVSLNHIQAMSIMISTFHHGKIPSAIDQRTFAIYTERTAFERPLTSGVAYAVKVLHSEREQFEKQQGWTIKSMDTLEQEPIHKDDYAVEKLEPSPVQEEYAPVIFAQDTVSHIISVDVLSGKEDRENVLRARASGKGVLTAPFPLLKTGRLGVILTFAVYKTDLPSSASPDERIQAADGYLGGVFDIESLVEKLLQQLASKQTILVNVYDTTNHSHPISMYGSNVSDDELEHVSPLIFGDPFRRHEMRCRFKQKSPWPWLAITTAIGILVIALLVSHIFHATLNRILRVEDDYLQMTKLKKRAEAADVAKSQFLATVSHEIRTPMNGVLGMLQMLMDTDLDVTQQDYVRTAQASGKALVSLINEVLDQAKIESGKLELEAVTFDLRAILDDVLSLFSGKSQEKGVELAVYISEHVPELVIGDPGRFRQIMTNLMGNSIKFTERGHIFVTIHLIEEVRDFIEVETELSPRNSLSGLPVADRRRSWAEFRAFSKDVPASTLSLSTSKTLVNLIISVEDTGCGIPVEAQSLIFTPFMQVGPRSGGTGIGLSISKCLVSLMSGDIGFASVPKLGSTFTFTAVFNRVCLSSDVIKNKPTKTPTNSTSAEFQGMTALVIDPRQVRVKVARYHILRLGINVEVAQDLNQGSVIISTGKPRIDMVFIEQEVWNKYLREDSLSNIINKLRIMKNGRKPPQIFLLTNNISCVRANSGTSGVDTPCIIMKPLRASMLAASLQRVMGVGKKGNSPNGGLPALPLQHLLRGRKILVVDDNAINLKVAAGALKKYGAEVDCVDSGRRAIEKLSPPHHFDACFMDIQMPEMDGFEATRNIRERERYINERIHHGETIAEPYENISSWHVPILAMTADVFQATHEKSLECGMDGYVSKPFEAEQLYREVSRFFNKSSVQ
ncbi:hypothetical protein SOVF_175550 [Spinacia oleracea]|nr:hypothetical protein SOVF_175550 [Spinacia oleracea]